MYGLYGFFFENCTDCTDYVRIFKKKLRIVRFLSKIVWMDGFFSKIVRIVRIFSENVRIFVRIFSKKFWPPSFKLLIFVLSKISNPFFKSAQIFSFLIHQCFTTINKNLNTFVCFNFSTLNA